MIEVIVVGEGQTEETVVREVLAPPLTALDISFQPRLIETSEHGRGGALTREHINDGRHTHPSIRLKTTLEPRYVKPLHGSKIAKAIGVERIRAECHHFNDWMNRIESLKPLR